jgi:hypothetical protein
MSTLTPALDRRSDPVISCFEVTLPRGKSQITRCSVTECGN